MATTFFLTSTASDIDPGTENESVASLTRGGTNTATSTSTVAGPTAGVQVVEATQLRTWLSKPLNAVTIEGVMTFNVWMSESNMAANVGAQVKVERCDNAGTVLSVILDREKLTELPVGTRAAQNWSDVPTSTALAAGDRLKITVFGNDAGGTMASGHTFSFSYNGPTSGSDGDSFVTFTETITEQSGTAHTRTAADTVAASDSVARGLVLGRTASDSVVTSDAVARIGTFLRALADSVLASDVVAGSKVLVREIVDSVLVGDSVARQATLTRAAADIVVTSEQVARIGTFLRSLPDTVVASDLVARTLTLGRSVGDSVPVSESVEAIKIGGGLVVRTAGDSVVTSDQVARVGTFIRALADSVLASDAVDRAVTSSRTVGDTVIVSDAISRRLVAGRVASDSVTIDDVVIRVGTFVRAITDTRAVSDSVAGTVVVYVISGVTRNSAGAVLPGAVVHCFRTSDDVEVGQVTSHAVTGAFSFNVAPGVAHYLVAYKAGATDVAGTTVNTLVGT